MRKIGIEKICIAPIGIGFECPYKLDMHTTTVKSLQQAMGELPEEVYQTLSGHFAFERNTFKEEDITRYQKIGKLMELKEEEELRRDKELKERGKGKRSNKEEPPGRRKKARTVENSSAGRESQKRTTSKDDEEEVDYDIDTQDS